MMPALSLRKRSLYILPLITCFCFVLSFFLLSSNAFANADFDKALALYRQLEKEPLGFVLLIALIFLCAMGIAIAASDTGSHQVTITVAEIVDIDVAGSSRMCLATTL